MPFDLMSHAEGSTSTNNKPKPPWSRTNSNDSESSVSPKGNGVDSMAEQLAAMKHFDQMSAACAKSKATPKPVAPLIATPGPSTLGPVQRTKDGDWVCRSCSKKNDALTDGDCTVPFSFKFCPACGDSDMGVKSRKTPPMVTEAWDCHCGETCPTSFCFCVECGIAAGAPKPPPAGVCGGCDEGMPESWKFCPDCSTEAGEWDGAAKARNAGTREEGTAQQRCKPIGIVVVTPSSVVVDTSPLLFSFRLVATRRRGLAVPTV